MNSPRSIPRPNRRRQALRKIVLILGVPLAVLFAIFSAGLYVGATRWRDAVVELEARWFGITAPMQADVVDAGPSSDPSNPDPSNPDPSNPDPSNQVSPAMARDPSAATVQDNRQDAPSDQVPIEPRPAESDPVKPGPETPAPPGETTPASKVPYQKGQNGQPSVEDDVSHATDLPTSLRDQFELPQSVYVKVLIDRGAIGTRKDWLVAVQQHIGRASEVFSRQFGIDLELHGIVQWPVENAGMSLETLMSDLRDHPREGADILLGLTSQPWARMQAGVAQAHLPQVTDRFNGAYAVAHFDPSGPVAANVASLLHAISHLFGATDVTDPTSASYRQGSWMSPDASVRAASESASQTGFWIDFDNRRRIIERKSHPFLPESSSAPASENAAAGDEHRNP